MPLCGSQIIGNKTIAYDANEKRETFSLERGPAIFKGQLANSHDHKPCFLQHWLDTAFKVNNLKQRKNICALGNLTISRKTSLKVFFVHLPRGESCG